MPIFDFICKKCKKEVEEHVKLNEVVKCPDCGEEMKKQISKKTSFVVHGYNAYNGYSK